MGLFKIIILVFMLCSCTTVNYVSNNPPFPKAGKKVAEELRAVCVPVERCEWTFDWLNRLAVLKDQMDVK